MPHVTKWFSKVVSSHTTNDDFRLDVQMSTCLELPRNNDRMKFSKCNFHATLYSIDIDLLIIQLKIIQINLVNNFEKTFTVLASINFHSWNQCNSTRNTNWSLLELIMTNSNCYVLLAPERFVHIDPHHLPTTSYLFLSNLIINLERRKELFYNFEWSDFVSLYQSKCVTNYRC